jgi:hypothetical protein
MTRAAPVFLLDLDELRQSGAFRVYEDPVDLLLRIEDAGGRR